MPHPFDSSVAPASVVPGFYSPLYFSGNASITKVMSVSNDNRTIPA